MRPLERIQIAGYKSIRDLDLKLEPLNVLIGANGAGKSNLISVFELLNQMVNENLTRYVLQAGGADAFLHYGRKSTDQIELAFTFRGEGRDLYNGYRCTLIPSADESLVFSEERILFHDRTRYGTPYDTDIGKGHRETQLHKVVKGSLWGANIARHVLQAMRGWRVYHFHDTSRTAQVKGMADIDDNEELRDDASNLAAYLYLLQQKHSDTYEKIVSTVQLVAPFFGEFDLKPNRLNPDKIRLEWKEKGSDAYFNVHALSDGTLRFISLTTLLQLPDPPSTIIIDEPELGLHPYAIALLAAQLRSAATRTQVIVSTQSVTLVNQFRAQDVIVVDRKDEQSVFSRPDEQALEDWLQEYGVGDLWEKNLLGGRPR